MERAKHFWPRVILDNTLCSEGAIFRLGFRALAVDQVQSKSSGIDHDVLSVLKITLHKNLLTFSKYYFGKTEFADLFVCTH